MREIVQYPSSDLRWISWPVERIDGEVKEIAKEMVRAADKANAKMFLKDNLKPIASNINLFANPSAVYPYGILRQEMPK